MASDARVKEILGDELKSRAPARSADAGSQLTKKDMGFFFPENEDTVDLCLLATVDRALAHDKVTITKKVHENVAVYRAVTGKRLGSRRVVRGGEQCTDDKRKDRTPCLRRPQ